jgi:anaerobic selenocysteine-containing dehydrogenase
LYNEKFLRDWVNWQDSLNELNPGVDQTFENFIVEIEKLYAEYTPEFAEKESGVAPETTIEIARQIGRAGTRFSCHNWRSAGAGNLGGWAVARCLHFLNVLTGSVGTEGGTSPSAWNKFKPASYATPPAQKFWNELHFPLEYPLSHYEMSFLLPPFPEGWARQTGGLFHTCF